MKTKIERQGSTEIPRFAVGALAIAGASAASGATVQITFTDNYVSAFNGLSFFTGDLTGDGFADVSAWASTTSVGVEASGFGAAVVKKNRFGASVTASVYGAPPVINTALTSGTVRAISSTVVTFSDSRINGGVLTSGLLDLTAAYYGDNSQDYVVKVNRLIFDDAGTSAPTGITATDSAYTEWKPSAIPEPSSLALLALGAGGLLARRRRAQAAA